MTKEKSSSSEEMGEVFYIQTTKGLFPLSKLQESEKRAASQQVTAKQERYLSDHGLIPHPFTASSILVMQDNCSYFDTTVRQIASDVVGQGYELKPRREGEEDQNEKDEIQEFLDDPNEEEADIVDIMKESIIDWGLFGWLGIEASRKIPGDPTSELNGLWHVPAHTFRVHKDNNKYCQIRNNKKAWFKAYGSEKNISVLTGEEVKGTKNSANELIFYKRYYPASDYYGVPPILPAVGSVMGLIGIRDYNLSFFENYGVPTALVILKGRWGKGSAEKISQFIDVEVKGSANAHKTLVLKPPAGGEVEWKPLVTKIEEAGFKVYMKALRDEVLSSYKMPPYRIGIAETGSLGGSVAEETTKIYAGSIVSPLKKATAKIITSKIIRKGLGLEKYKFEWKELDTRDMDAFVKRQEILFRIGAITPSQIREELGWKGYEGGTDYYVASNYMPIGQEAMVKREHLLTAELENLNAKIEEAIRKQEEK